MRLCLTFGSASADRFDHAFYCERLLLSYSQGVSVSHSIVCRSSVTQRHWGATSSFFDTCSLQSLPRDGSYDAKTRDFLFGAALAMRRSGMNASRQLLNLVAQEKQLVEALVTVSTFTPTRADREDKSK